EAREQLGMRVVFLDEHADELGGVLREVERAELSAQAEMAVDEGPFGEGAELFFKIEREDGLAEVEQVDSAAEFTGALLGGAVSALGDNADDAVGLAEEG